MPPTENHNNKRGESGAKTVSLVDLVKGGLSSGVVRLEGKTRVTTFVAE